MVNLSKVRSCNAQLVKTRPLVAVFVGGTSGIGEYAVRALANVHGKEGKGLRLYIVGRNEAAAKTIISACQEACPTGQFYFISAHDLSLLNDVDRVCDELMKFEEAEAKARGETPRIDFLVMTQGYLAFETRQETTEGLDMIMSLLYYSRMRFTTRLLPLLLAAPAPAHIVSVFGPGRDARFYPSDLSLRSPQNYSFMASGSHVAYFTTFYMEELARRHEGRLSLTHYYPGLVVTNGFGDDRLPGWFKFAWRLLLPLIRATVAVPEGECGERVVFFAGARFPAREEGRGGSQEGSRKMVEDGVEVAMGSDGVLGGGAYRSGPDGEVVPLGKKYPKLREEGMREKCWEHTQKAFEEIEAGRVFKG